MSGAAAMADRHRERVSGVVELPPESDELASLLAIDPAPEVRVAAANRCTNLGALAAAWDSETDPAVRAALASALAIVLSVILTPSHQWPTGSVLSAGRRAAAAGPEGVGVTRQWAFSGPPPTDGFGASSVTLIEGSAFCISGPGGDIVPGGSQGLFVRDTRVVSRWELTLDGTAPSLLTVQHGEPFAATFLSRVPPRPGLADSTLLVVRRRVTRTPPRSPASHVACPSGSVR